ncbi:hypothetical protein RJP56_16480 [Shewanella baltica]|uniref:WYL domain-containing protein n=1 Tax=Shewanella baltica TaxID=62322 RepID=UPI0028729845|nr:WYL domain-containing protein [Shewanella baltica]MDR9767659.1 hypothetical protein [Shewanella baltica]
MDYSYFLNEAGKYTAKRLPSPKGAAIKLKDVTDMTGLRYDLIDYKPQTESQFSDVYHNNFDSVHSYEIEIEQFSDIVERNPKALLGKEQYLAPYLDTLLYTYDQDELVDDYEWKEVTTDFAKVLVKADLATQKNQVDNDDWFNAFNRYKKPELQAMAKPLGIKVSQTKDELINELVKHQVKHNDLIPPPCLILFKSELKDFISNIQHKYIDLIDSALATFDYPRVFEATVWYEVSEFNDDFVIIYELSKERLSLFNDIDGAVESLEPIADNIINMETSPSTQFITTSDLAKQQSKNDADDLLSLIGEGKEIIVSPAVVIIFDYIDRDGNASSRELRLDKIVTNEQTYLYGFCLAKLAARHFRLDRIRGQIVLKDTGELLAKSEFIEYFGLPTSSSTPVKQVVKNSNTANNKSKIEQSTFTVDMLDRKVTPALGLGIFLLPIIFAWFTLRKGYSVRARVISFVWLIFVCLNAFSDNKPNTAKVSEPIFIAKVINQHDSITHDSVA